MSSSGSNTFLEKKEAQEAIDSALLHFFQGKPNFFVKNDISKLYNNLRPGNKLSENQIEAAIVQITGYDGFDSEDILDILNDLDRRFYLSSDLKWEFELLDTNSCGSIPIKKGYFLFRMVHGDDCRQSWESFIAQRGMPSAPVSFEELEVILCNLDVY